MGKHFSESELDNMHKWAAAGISPIEIHQRMQKARARMRKGCPDLTSVRRALKGNAFKRSRVETRGRPRILSAANLRAVDRARKQAILKADGEYEVHWEDIIRAARIPGADRTWLHGGQRGRFSSPKSADIYGERSREPGAALVNSPDFS